MMATFSDDEWDALTSHDKHALKAIGRVAPASFEPLRKFRGVGETKIQSLLEKKLVEEGRSVPRNEVGYRLTDKGWLALDRSIGRRSFGAFAT
jgi:hypothetical protein